jgi:hypothetical protein
VIVRCVGITVTVACEARIRVNAGRSLHVCDA